MSEHTVESDAAVDLADLDGGLRGTVADAVDFARECSEDWGVRVAARVESRRTDLPQIIARRAEHDGPVWIIRPACVTSPAATDGDPR